MASKIIPPRLVEAKYYHFNQNNSGGKFTIDDRTGIGPHVWIEAESKADAISRAEDLGIYFDGVDAGRDCHCCGDRWYAPWDNDGVDTPEITHPTGKGIFREGSFGWHDTIYIHHIDGTIERVKANPPKEKTHDDT